MVCACTVQDYVLWHSFSTARCGAEQEVAVTHRNPANRMVDAAKAWLDSLDNRQQTAAAVPWPSDEERHRCYYTPTDHGGLPLQQMRPAQQSLAMQLLATGLSRPGYVTASTIMGLENVLDQVENWQVGWGRERGRDPQLYWLRISGEPDMDGPWSWRFGGHHVSVKHLILDGQVQASSPAFLGADPAESPLLGGHLLRPLGATERPGQRPGAFPRRRAGLERDHLSGRTGRHRRRQPATDPGR